MRLGLFRHGFERLFDASQVPPGRALGPYQTAARTMLDPGPGAGDRRNKECQVPGSPVIYICTLGVLEF